MLAALASFNNSNDVVVSESLDISRHYYSGSISNSYDATTTFVLNIDEVSQVGHVIDNALSIGKTRLGSIVTQLKTPQREQTRGEALAKAIGNAKMVATAMAHAAGLTDCKIMSIKEAFGDSTSSLQTNAYGGGTRASSAYNIVPGLITIGAEVEYTLGCKPK